MGLKYLDASISQFLRGGLGIIFVALMKQTILKDRLVSFIDFVQRHPNLGHNLTCAPFDHYAYTTVHISLGWCGLDCCQCGVHQLGSPIAINLITTYYTISFIP